MARPLVLREQALLGGLQQDAVGQAQLQSLRKMENLDVVHDPAALKVRNGYGTYWDRALTGVLLDDAMTLHRVYNFKLKDSSDLEQDYIYLIYADSSNWYVGRIEADRTDTTPSITLIATHTGSLPTAGVQMVKVDERVIYNTSDGLRFNSADIITSHASGIISSGLISIPSLSRTAADIYDTSNSNWKSVVSQIDYNRYNFDDTTTISGNPLNPYLDIDARTVAYVGDNVLAAPFLVGPNAGVAINMVRLKFFVYCPPGGDVTWDAAGTRPVGSGSLAGPDVNAGFNGRFKIAICPNGTTGGDTIYRPSSIEPNMVESSWVSVKSLQDQVTVVIPAPTPDTNDPDAHNLHGSAATIEVNQNPDSPDRSEGFVTNLHYRFEFPEPIYLEPNERYSVVLYGDEAWQLGWVAGETASGQADYNLTWNDPSYYNGNSWLYVGTGTGNVDRRHPRTEAEPNTFDNTFQWNNDQYGTGYESAGSLSGKWVDHQLSNDPLDEAQYLWVDFGRPMGDSGTGKTYYLNYTNTGAGIDSNLSAAFEALGVGTTNLPENNISTGGSSIRIAKQILIDGITAVEGADKVNIWRKRNLANLTEADDGNTLFLVATIPLTTGTVSVLDNTDDLALANSNTTTVSSLNELTDNDDLLIPLNGLVEWNERIWGFNGQSLRFSDRIEEQSFLGLVGDSLYDSFHIENSLDFTDKIVSLVPLTEGLVVFFADKIKLVTGGYQVLNPPPDIAIRDVSMTDGIFAMDTATSYKGQVVFVNQYKEVKLLSPTGAIQEISDVNQSLMNSLSDIVGVTIYQNQIVINSGDSLLLLDMSRNIPYWRQYKYSVDLSGSEMSIKGLFNDLNNRLLAYTDGNWPLYILDEGNSDNTYQIPVSLETHIVQHSSRERWSKFQLELNYISSVIPTLTVTATAKDGTTSSKEFKAASSNDVRSHTGGLRMVSESCSLGIDFKSTAADEIRYIGFA